MAEFSYEKFVKNVAEKALDEFLYNGKSIREWIQIIASEDAISRQVVLEQTYSWSKDEFLRVTNPFDYLRKRINSLPPVTAEQKPQQEMEQWILTMPRGAEEWCYKCSKCGFWKYRKTIDLSKFNYCPNCGAKMQEVKE